jgi:hypothetical protein
MLTDRECIIEVRRECKSACFERQTVTTYFSLSTEKCELLLCLEWPRY